MILSQIIDLWETNVVNGNKEEGISERRYITKMINHSKSRGGEECDKGNILRHKKITCIFIETFEVFIL